MEPRADHREVSDVTTTPFLARVVQKVDSAIHRINHYTVFGVVRFVNTYPLDSDLSCGSRYPVLLQAAASR